MTDKRETERRLYGECGQIGCWAVYNVKTGQVIRITDCMCAVYLASLIQDEQEAGGRLRANCPIDGVFPS